MSKARKKYQLKTRITVAFSNKRSQVEPVRRDEEKAHPEANVKIAGGPGEWKVRRDVLDSEDVKPARDLRRY